MGFNLAFKGLNKLFSFDPHRTFSKSINCREC